jgi:hypothetical protein
MAEDDGIDIYYQDNDSMHMDANGVDQLCAKYKQVTGKDLMGKGLFQFKSEFEELDHDPGTRPVATDVTYLMKKTYAEKVTCIVNGEEKTTYVLRAKGIPNDCLQNTIDSDFGGDPMELFSEALLGGEVVVDLMKSKSMRVKFGKNFTVEKVNEFTRTIKL